MNRPTHEQLLAFLDGTLEAEERTRLLDHLERDPQLAREFRSAALGHVAIDALRVNTAPETPTATSAGRRISPWWAAAAAAIAVALTIPATWWASARGDVEAASSAPQSVRIDTDGGFVLVLHGRWPDVATVTQPERSRRADEYWSWALSLADAGLLLAAGNLRAEPGQRFGPDGVAVSVPAQVTESPDFVVGMFVIRAETYEEAVSIAMECPHIQYGGSISVRQLETGLMTPRVSGG